MDFPQKNNFDGPSICNFNLVEIRSGNHFANLPFWCGEIKTPINVNKLMDTKYLKSICSLYASYFRIETLNCC